MEGLKNKLASIREKVHQFAIKNVFNMGETRLFYRHSLATYYLKGKK